LHNTRAGSVATARHRLSLKLYAAELNSRHGYRVSYVERQEVARKTVVSMFRKYYLPHKPMLLDKLPKMAGIAWGAGVRPSSATATC
jgi:hypothetical protein